MTLGNASSLEIIYTAIISIGVGFSAWCLREAILDRRANRRKRTIDDLREERASSNVKAEAARLMVLLSFLGVGILAMKKPPESQIPDEFTVLVRVAFLIATVALSYNSWAAYRHRRNVAAFDRENRR